MLSEVECDEIEDEKGSETSIKVFTIKALKSEMVSLGEGGETRVGVKVFLRVGCKAVVIKDKVKSVYGFGG